MTTCYRAHVLGGHNCGPCLDPPYNTAHDSCFQALSVEGTPEPPHIVAPFVLVSRQEGMSVGRKEYVNGGCRGLIRTPPLICSHPYDTNAPETQ